MAHPYASKAKTGQQIADARYTPVANTTPKGSVFEDAKVTSRGERAPDEFTAAPTRQVSETGKVRK